MKNIRYLCNMKTKNLYMNNGEPMCKALVINEKCPPQFSYRFTRLTVSLSLLSNSIYIRRRQTLALLLLAQAFSGRVFCAERRAYDS